MDILCKFQVAIVVWLEADIDLWYRVKTTCWLDDKLTSVICVWITGKVNVWLGQRSKKIGRIGIEVLFTFFFKIQKVLSKQRKSCRICNFINLIIVLIRQKNQCLNLYILISVIIKYSNNTARCVGYIDQC